MLCLCKMGEEGLKTSLVYTKSPKTSKRTTFQDELEAAVTARAGRHDQPDSRPRDFHWDHHDEDDEDDILQQLLKTRRKKMDLFQATSTKPKLNHFRLSDDEEENLKPKKVPFLKSSRRNETNEQQVEPSRSQSEASTLKKSISETLRSHTSESNASTRRTSQSESPVPLISENSQRDSSSVSLPSRSGQEASGRVSGENGAPVPPPRRRSPSGLMEDDAPRPVPRQRLPNTGSSGNNEEDGSETLTSVPLSSTGWRSTVSVSYLRTAAFERDTVQPSDERHTSVLATTHSTSLEGTASTDLLTVEQIRTEEEWPESVQEHPGPAGETVSRLKPDGRPPSSRPASSSRSRSAESRYLGTLKILDQKHLQETEPNAADFLRAAVYQEWLKKKEEKLQEILRAKKQEEKQKEEKKIEDELSKRTDAKASYEAWKEKKQETIREKIKEKQCTVRKQQQEKEEKEERKESAKRVFEKWKQEHDALLREQHRKKVQTEKRLKESKEREQEKKRRESSSTFTQWSERKTSVLLEKVRDERRKKELRAMEEMYIKEEREKEALEVYDRWLRTKEVQQKQERHEKKVKSNIAEDPPPLPPWSPPNRTVPFGK